MKRIICLAGIRVLCQNFPHPAFRDSIAVLICPYFLPGKIHWEYLGQKRHLIWFLAKRDLNLILFRQFLVTPNVDPAVEMIVLFIFLQTQDELVIIKDMMRSMPGRT